MHVCFQFALNRTLQSTGRQSLSCTTKLPSVVRGSNSKTLKRRFLVCTSHCVDKVLSQDWDGHSSRYEVPRFKLQPPLTHDLNDPQTWIQILDRVLPEHLKDGSAKSSEEGVDADVDGADVGYFLTSARRHAQVDLIKHLALHEGRWNVVLWIVKKVSQLDGPEPGLQHLLRSTSRQSWLQGRTLTEITDTPIWANKSEFRHDYELQSLTSSGFDVSNSGWNFRRGGLGQIWRSLGSLILSAIHEHQKDSSLIMERVREFLAVLHHADVIPKAVYQYMEFGSPFGLRQPPTLYLLSSRIFKSLSDAAWNAHQVAATDAAKKAGIDYDAFVHPAPGAMYKVRVLALGPELWLELVLWSCLHGPWVLDGAAILKELISHKSPVSWSLIRWMDTLQSFEKTDLSTSDLIEMKAQLDAKNPKLRKTEHERDRLRVQHTISAEVVVAYVDGLINMIGVGVGVRGASLSKVLEHIKALKSLLERSNMDLGLMSWDAAIARILESEGINLEKAPRVQSEVMKFAQSNSKRTEELKVLPSDPYSTNQGPQSRFVYFMEPTALPLGLHHRILRFHISKSNISGTLRTFRQLQEFTDVNKLLSIEDFARTLHELRNANILQDFSLHSSMSSASNFSNFHPRLSKGLLSALLDLMTKSNAIEFGRWLIYSNDVDGTSIPVALYSDPTLAGSLIRFASATADKELISRVLEEQFKRGKMRNGRIQLPLDILLVFLESQMEFRKWSSTKTLLEYLQDRDENMRVSYYVAILTRELLRMGPKAASTVDSSFLQGWQLLQQILQGQYGRAAKDEANRLVSVLGVLSTVDEDWKRLCSQFLIDYDWRYLTLPTSHFDLILQGVLEGYGSQEGLRICKFWCEGLNQQDQHIATIRSGLQKLPAEDKHHVDTQRRVHVALDHNRELLFVGHVEPKMSTVKIIVRGTLQQQKQRRAPHPAMKEIAQWSVDTFWRLGLGVEDIDQEMEALDPTTQTQ